MPQAQMPSREEMQAFITTLKEFVLAEAAAQKQAVQQIWRLSLPERVQRGQAIEGVHVVGRAPGEMVILRCERNKSGFREGDILCLHRGDPFGGESHAFMVALEEEDHLSLTIHAYGIPWQTFDTQRTGWVIDKGYLDLSKIILDALKNLADSHIGRTRIIPLLMHRLQPDLSPTRFDRGLALGEAAGLNDDQADALASAYAADILHLIQGPPGTGKTYVLANLARVLAQEGERVFITGLTHRAINNALNKIRQIDPDLPLIKVGSRNQAHDLDEGVENFERFNASPLKDLDNGYVIGATPFATQTPRLMKVEFETVIFDEASQLTLPLTIMGMLVGRKYVLFGDHHQLPPVLAGGSSEESEAQSVFQQLIDHGFDSMLTETYRLNEALTVWPNRHFYEGHLVSVFADRQIVYPLPLPRHKQLLDPDVPIVFWDLRHQNATNFSQLEANAIVDLIMVLDEAGHPMTEIGVVVPYRAQARLIRSQLYHQLSAEKRSQLVIDTVERMQGQERDIVLISLTTSNATYAARLADFFFQPQRINVAVTRPRCKLVIVGSSKLLETSPATAKQQAAVDKMRDLILSAAFVVELDG